MAEPIVVSARLTNGKVRFLGLSQANPDHPITFDYAPPLGDGQGFAGLELLLLSLAGCSATAVVYLLRRRGKTVAAFHVDVVGTKRPSLPPRLAHVTLDFVLASPDTTAEELGQVVREAETSVCPVWATIRGNVEVTARHRLVAE